MARLTTGFVACLPGPDADLSAHSGRFRRFAADAGLEIIRNQPYLFACSSNHPVDASVTGASMIVDVFTGTAAACGSAVTVKVNAGSDWEAIHYVLHASVQVYNAIEAGDDFLRLESDFLGIKSVYLAQVDGAALLASSLRMLRSAFPQTMSGGDELGVAEILLFGTPLYERTLHRGISRIQTGTCLEWRNGKLETSRRRRFLPPPVESDLSAPEATRCIKDETSRVLTTRLEHVSKPVAIGLSGGFDSRLVAAMACDARVPLRAYSYGQAHHTETMCAQAVARRLNLPWTLLPYDADSIFNGLPLYLEHVEGQADLMMAQITNLMQIAPPLGTLLHGYLGDALSGAHLEWLISPRPRTRDEVASDVVAHRAARSGIEGRTICEVVGLDVSLDDVRHHIASNLPADVQAHQMLLLFDCENRQRRSVGSQLPMLGSRFHVIAPNYDPAVFAAYFRLPRITLDDREILRQVFARCWPALAEIPHAEEHRPIVPRFRTMLPFAIRHYKHALARKLIGHQRYEKLQRRWADPYLWRMSYGNASAAHAERIRRRIIDCRTILQAQFGIRGDEKDLSRVVVFPGHTVEPHLARRLFALAEYGNAIDSSTGAASGQFQQAFSR